MPPKVKWTISFLIGAGLVWFGWFVPMFMSVFHVLLCIVLVLIILMQSGSAADLAGAFGGAGSQTSFGPRTAATFLTKMTVWCAVMFMATSLALSLHQTGPVPGVNSVLSQTTAPASKEAPAKKPAPQPKPAAPAPVHLPPANTPPPTPKPPAKQ
jgi:preprotein translocase subunit SecG